MTAATAARLLFRWQPMILLVVLVAAGVALVNLGKPQPASNAKRTAPPPPS